MTTTRLMRLPEVMNRVGLGRSKIYQLIATGEFPKQVKIGRSSLWREGDIQQFLDGLGNA